MIDKIKLTAEWIVFLVAILYIGSALVYMVDGVDAWNSVESLLPGI